MKTIGAFEAKTNLSQLLEQVERGESFLDYQARQTGRVTFPGLGPKAAGPKGHHHGISPETREILEEHYLEEIAELRDTGKR